MNGSARYWREIPQRYRLEAAKCDGCGRIAFPPRVLCPGCRGRKFSKHVLAPEGRLESFTVIRVAPSGFSDLAPYAVGIVTLDDGVKLTAQVADCDPATLAVGRRMRIEFRRLRQEGESGILCYGYKVVPVDRGIGVPAAT
ncbi:MAG: Zn-ribbon domain-containing OB-fold protein [Planctomycetaceae bacterium]|nr:Zn-ribbon domain-containing OB-fold protein [Planctomycetota bacterium]NUN52586.1 Zn-ribbon domain-containing OB-fold protein [Planctomycetaceae bacterium]